MKLPVSFEEKMKRLLKEEFDAYIDCYEKPRFYGLRVNTRKISVEDFRKICPFPITPIPWIENGFYYDGATVSPGKHPYYAAGLYYLQEPSAMTPANRLPVFPGERVLDLCAAPGGKATELGAKLEGKGLLVANDISSSRAKGLLKNLELFGIGNLLVLSEEPGRLAQYFPEYFHKILIDAPCSGEGMFRKDKKMVRAWEEHGPDYFCKIQKHILLQAADMLRPGGMILYSTCTFDERENEQAVAFLMEERPEFTIREILPYDGFAQGIPQLSQTQMEELKKTVRIFPHKLDGEGHYLALLQKGEMPLEEAKPLEEDPEKLSGFHDPASGSSGNPRRSPPSMQRHQRGRVAEIPEELSLFWKDMNWELSKDRLEIHGERVYYMPLEVPQLGGARFLRTGLLLGDWKKRRFEPSQAFAMSLKKEEYQKILDFSCADERVGKYLKGETLEVFDLVSPSAKGWYLVCVDGYSLGWGKLSEGTLKNKYLAGWRLS